MSGTTAICGYPYPSLSDAPNVPSDIQKLATALDTDSVHKFSSASARSAVVPSPTDGLVTYLTSVHRAEYFYNGYWRPFPGNTSLALTSANLAVTNLDNGVRTVWSYNWTPNHPGTYEIWARTPFDGTAGEQAHIWLYQGSTLIDDNIVTFPQGGFIQNLWLGGIINVTSTATINLNVQSQRSYGGSFFNSRNTARMLNVKYVGIEGIPATG